VAAGRLLTLKNAIVESTVDSSLVGVRTEMSMKIQQTAAGNLDLV